MLRELKQTIGRNLINIPGWRTNRKILVIESDDWGSIRMPSKHVYEKCLRAGIKVDKCAFCSYDALANKNDFTALYETLYKFTDKKGNNPIITANCIVANPDFDKINASNYTEYFFEKFTDTLHRAYPNEDVFSLWQEGITKKLFYPQFHGREHLNVNRWLNYLQNGSKETLFAFSQGLFGLSTNVVSEKRDSYMAAYGADSIQEFESQKAIIRDGLSIFEEIFGYKSKSLIAPNYIWSSQIEQTLAQNGVCFIQSAKNQITPRFEEGKTIKHILGQRNHFSQIYLVRNCYFEPSDSLVPVNALKSCFEQVETAFRWGKPAIISSHRLNYIGGIVDKNRTDNLELLGVLLDRITRKWHDLEFMTSDQLGEIISKSR